MPIVPATPVSRTRQQILGAPARLGTISDARELAGAIGGLTQAVTGEITAHMQTLKNEATQNEARLAESQYLDRLNAAMFDGPSAFMNRRGNAARDAFVEGRAFMNNEAEQIRDSLSSDAAKMFKAAADRTRASFGTQLIKHVGQQTEQARVESLAAVQASLQEQVAKSRDPEEREEGASALRNVIAQLGEGSTPEQIEIEQNFAIGKSYGQAAVNAVNSGDITQAQQILDSDNGQNIESSTREKVERKIGETQHAGSVSATVQNAWTQFPDASQAAQAEAEIRRTSSGAVESNALTAIRKQRTAEATAVTAQRKAENEAAHKVADDVIEQRRTGQLTLNTQALIAQGEQMALRIEDSSKRASFQKRWDDEVVNGFAPVTNQAQYTQADLMTWQEMQGLDLRELKLERGDYQKLLKKQNASPSNHTNLTTMQNNAIFDLGLDPTSDEAFNLRQNFKNDIEVLEKKVGPLSQSELDTVMDELKKRSVDTNRWFWQDDTDISLQSIEDQFSNIPAEDEEIIRDQLSRTLGKRPEDVEEREIVAANRRFLNEQAIGFGRIAEPETTAGQEQ